MSLKIFWGEGGEYGPYTEQEDGWPHAGEVMRDYRLKMKMSADEAACIYSEAVEAQRNVQKGGTKAKPITASWILNMEKENRVPTDVTRRRLLADMFGIPYALFGLSSLEQIVFKPRSEMQTHIPSSTQSSLSKNVSEDTAQHEKNIRLFWQLHYTSTAYGLLNDVDAAILQLEAVEKISNGRLQEHIQTLLNSYCQLGTEITRSQGTFAKSYFYANNAVRVTKNIGIAHMIALAQFRRGYTSLVWGLFDKVDSSGEFILDVDKVNAAIRDFEQALPHALPQLKGYIKLELSRAYGHLNRSSSDVTIALSLLGQARATVGIGTLDDPYTPIKNLNEGMYHIGSAITLTAVGRHGKAIEELDSLEYLKDAKGIGRNQTPRHAWIDILYAKASLGTREYYEATRRATNALLTCKDIYSANNIAIIRSIHSQLLKSPYKAHHDTTELGKMLTSYYHSQKAKHS